jgi:TolB-like protein/DNA-binding winged helix-turn-helix (wHTH) protein
VNGHCRYTVGDLTVDEGQSRVTRSGIDVPLPKLSFDLLVALVRAAPNVLSLDTLMDQVWPGLVVSPETVSQRVKLLRDALGDDPKHPRYIVGVRGRGYRLCAPVNASIEALSEPEVPVPLSAPAPTRSRSRTFLRVLAIGVAGIVVAALAWWLLSNPRTHQGAERVVISAAMPRSIAVLPFENLSQSPADHVISLGVPEAVLHQLASLNELSVIARTSSFAYQGRNEDARAIGRQLNARYLLEGSVQSAGGRLRVTAQLIDGESGAHVWSMRFDRAREDIFALQDEIATQVARALKLSLDGALNGKSANQDTQNVDAWLAYMQGRALSASRKLPDLHAAKERFEEAIRLDDTFGSAYAALAETYILEAFFQPSEFWFHPRPQLSPEDADRVQKLLARALELNPQNGDAYIVRAWTEGRTPEAEADFRRGLAMSPNNAAGFERFARVLTFMYDEKDEHIDLAKREEAFVMIDRARALDPLTPTNHLTKGLMELYTRSNVAAADELIMQALQRDPNYYPALMRLAELRWCCQGRFAQAVQLGERALAIEPDAVWPRRFLIHFYLDVGAPDAAVNVAATAPRPDPMSEVAIYLQRRDWKQAAALSYSPPPQINGIDVNDMIVAFGMNSRAPTRTSKDLDWLRDFSDVTWTEEGKPVLHDATHDYGASVMLGEILAREGDHERATAVWEAALAAMDYEARTNHRGEFWFASARSRALALLGKKELALAALEQSFAGGLRPRWEWLLEIDPAYDNVRHDPRFIALRARAHAHADEERRKLDAMRVAKLVPTRTAAVAGSKH